MNQVVIDKPYLSYELGRENLRSEKKTPPPLTQKKEKKTLKKQDLEKNKKIKNIKNT